MFEGYDGTQDTTTEEGRLIFADEVDPMLVYTPPAKAQIDIAAGFTIYLPQPVRWFHRKMMGWFFGWRVTNLKPESSYDKSGLGADQ